MSSFLHKTDNLSAGHVQAQTTGQAKYCANYLCENTLDQVLYGTSYNAEDFAAACVKGNRLYTNGSKHVYIFEYQYGYIIYKPAPNHYEIQSERYLIICGDISHTVPKHGARASMTAGDSQYCYAARSKNYGASILNILKKHKKSLSAFSGEGIVSVASLNRSQLPIIADANILKAHRTLIKCASIISLYGLYPSRSKINAMDLTSPTRFYHKFNKLLTALNDTELTYFEACLSELCDVLNIDKDCEDAKRDGSILGSLRRHLNENYAREMILRKLKELADSASQEIPSIEEKPMSGAGAGSSHPKIPHKTITPIMSGIASDSKRRTVNLTPTEPTGRPPRH